MCRRSHRVKEYRVAGVDLFEGLEEDVAGFHATRKTTPHFTLSVHDHYHRLVICFWMAAPDEAMSSPALKYTIRPSFDCS